MKKVVTIGGGTGQYTLLRGLKKYDISLTAIVNIVDSGGSSGELRTSFGVLPPGDVRNCLLALTDDVKLKDLKGLFEHRFEKGLNNHNMGNLILTALTQRHGNFSDAIKSASNILNLKHNVLPVSTDDAHICAQTDKGNRLEKEFQVNYPPKGEKIKQVWLEPSIFVNREAADALRDADMIVISAGELYGSILPNFLVKGIKEALSESDAKITYVCNMVTKQGTYGFKASDFVKELEKYLSKKIDHVICNTRKPEKKVVDKYKEEESYFVEPDLEGEHVVKRDLLEEFNSGGKIVARHDENKLARTIMELL